MELPFLAKNKRQGGGTPALEVTRGSDNGTNTGALMESVAGELLEAIERKDFNALRESLSALVSMINQKDDE